VQVKTKKIKSTLNVNVPCKKRSCLLNQTINKDNVPPQQKKCPKSTRTNKNATINLKNKWRTKGLKEAMDVVERGITSLRKINFGILYLTLLSNTSTRRPNPWNKAH